MKSNLQERTIPTELTVQVKTNKNLYKVPLKQWRKWSAKAREIFNVVYSTALDNQKVIAHPKQKRLPPGEWKTISWNAAWLAADAADGR